MIIISIIFLVLIIIIIMQDVKFRWSKWDLMIIMNHTHDRRQAISQHKLMVHWHIYKLPCTHKNLAIKVPHGQWDISFQLFLNLHHPSFSLFISRNVLDIMSVLHPKYRRFVPISSIKCIKMLFLLSRVICRWRCHFPYTCTRHISRDAICIQMHSIKQIKCVSFSLRCAHGLFYYWCICNVVAITEDITHITYFFISWYLAHS